MTLCYEFWPWPQVTWQPCDLDCSIKNLLGVSRCCCLPKSLCTGLSLPANVAKLSDVSSHGNTEHMAVAREITEDEDDDVPLLTMENPTQYIGKRMCYR